MRLCSVYACSAPQEKAIPGIIATTELQFLAAEVLRFKNLLADKVEELRSWTHNDDSDHEDISAILSAYERALERA